MNVSDLINRPRIYAFEDGVMELAFGLFLVASVAGFLALRVLPSVNFFYVFLPGAILLLSGLGAAWLTKRFKIRFTYPRGGYVAFDEKAVTSRGQIPQRVVNVAIVLGVAFSMRWLRHLPNLPAAATIGASILFVAVYLFEGMKYRMPHMLWLSASSVLLGSVIFARNDGSEYVILWQGLALAVVGSVRLWRFIRSHPRPVETEA